MPKKERRGLLGRFLTKEPAKPKTTEKPAQPPVQPVAEPKKPSPITSLPVQLESDAVKGAKKAEVVEKPLDVAPDDDLEVTEPIIDLPDDAIEDISEDDFQRAAKFVIETGRANRSGLRAGLGIPDRDAKAMLQVLESAGVVSEQRDNGARAVLLSLDQFAQKYPEKVEDETVDGYNEAEFAKTSALPDDGFTPYTLEGKGRIMDTPDGLKLEKGPDLPDAERVFNEATWNTLLNMPDSKVKAAALQGMLVNNPTGVNEDRLRAIAEAVAHLEESDATPYIEWLEKSGYVAPPQILEEGLDTAPPLPMPKPSSSFTGKQTEPAQEALNPADFEADIDIDDVLDDPKLYAKLDLTASEFFYELYARNIKWKPEQIFDIIDEYPADKDLPHYLMNNVGYRGSEADAIMVANKLITDGSIEPEKAIIAWSMYRPMESFARYVVALKDHIEGNDMAQLEVAIHLVGNDSVEAWQVRDALAEMNTSDENILLSIEGVDSHQAWELRDGFGLNPDNQVFTDPTSSAAMRLLRSTKGLDSDRAIALRKELFDAGMDEATMRSILGLKNEDPLGFDIEDEISDLDPDDLEPIIDVPEVSRLRKAVNSLMERIRKGPEEYLRAKGIEYGDLPPEIQAKLGTLEAEVQAKADKLLELRKALVEAEQQVDSSSVLLRSLPGFNNRYKERVAKLEKARSEYAAQREAFVADNVSHALIEMLAIQKERAAMTEQARAWPMKAVRGALSTLEKARIGEWRLLNARVMLPLGITVGSVAYEAITGNQAVPELGTAGRLFSGVSGAVAMNDRLKGFTTNRKLRQIDALLEQITQEGRSATPEEAAQLREAVAYVSAAAALEGRSVANNESIATAIELSAKQEGGITVKELMATLDAKLDTSKNSAFKKQFSRTVAATAFGMAVGSGLMAKLLRGSYQMADYYADGAISDKVQSIYNSLASGWESVTGGPASPSTDSAAAAIRMPQAPEGSAGSGVAGGDGGVSAEPTTPPSAGAPAMEASGSTSALDQATDAADKAGTTDAEAATAVQSATEMLQDLPDAERALYLIGKGDGISNPMYRQLFAKASEFGFSGEVPSDISNLRALEGTPWKEWADKIVLETLKETKMQVDGKMVSLWDASNDQNVWTAIKDRFAVVLDKTPAGKFGISLVDTQTNTVLTQAGGAAVDAGFNVTGTQRFFEAPDTAEGTARLDAAESPKDAFASRADRIKSGISADAMREIMSKPDNFITPEEAYPASGYTPVASELAGYQPQNLAEAAQLSSAGTGPEAASATQTTTATTEAGGGNANSTTAAVESATPEEVAADTAADLTTERVARLNPGTLDFTSPYGSFLGELGKKFTQQFGDPSGVSVSLQQNGLELLRQNGDYLVRAVGSQDEFVPISKKVFDGIRDIVSSDQTAVISEDQLRELVSPQVNS